MSLYAQFHDIDSVIRVFNTLEKPHTIAWNLIIKSHLDLGLFDSALLLYKTMRHLGVAHDSFTFPIVNQAVLSLQSDVIYGEMVHCVSTKMGFGFEVYFCNTMIEVYVKCGCVVYARKLFDEMSQRDLVSWTSMISGYVCEGSVGSAFYLFREMMVKSEPNSVTLIIMLQACCAGESLIHGMQLHGYAIKSGLESDGSLQNSVLKMYTRTGSVEEVEIFFSKIDRKDDVSWNILISFYSMKGDIEKLVNRFSEMQGIAALSIETLTLLISAFAKSRDLFQGEQIHCLAIKSGFCDDVLLTSLLDFYAKCGKIEISDQLFRKISYRNNVTFGAMMSGFVQNGYVKDAINLFHQMQAANVEPGAEILRSILDAYTQLGALQLGKAIHGYFIRHIFCRTMEETTYLEASILNMYIRCGNISSARVSFHNILVKDLVIWTTMIEGFGTHGLGSEALELFGLMLKERIKPNSVTFLSLLSACSHSGLVREGCEVYNSMKWIFGIQPNLDHYTCMVDLLGRYGKLKEALAIIVKMVIFSDGRIWGALLAACRVHGDIKLGEYTAQRLLELEPDNVGYHTLLSNVQAGVGRWDEVEEIDHTIKWRRFMTYWGWLMMSLHIPVSLISVTEWILFFIRVRLLQNRLNVNPSVEEKWVSGMGAIHESLNRKCLPLCSDHINDLYTGKITLQDIDCTSFVDVD
uniref:Pentatricopeptide repeat-containing protein n=1 Tax=Fagus sylvatica TaxID=28930 RepID=A0A2N9HGM1_FAGSY